MRRLTIEERLWTYTCSGDIESLKNYYENGGEKNIRHNAFNKDHSMIMGAFRNQEWKTVDYLLSVGETITAEEIMEISTELKRIETMQKILKAMGGN